MTGRTLFVALVAVPLATGSAAATVGGDPPANLDPAKVASSVGITSQPGSGRHRLHADRSAAASSRSATTRKSGAPTIPQRR